MSTNGTTTFSKQQIQQCQEIVQNLRVHELHQLLSIFHYPKLGKKQELVQRAQTVLSNPKYQAKAAQKVLEIQASNRIREAMHPYSPTGNINGSMHPPYSGAVGGPMSAPVPASSSPSVIAGGGGMLHPGSAAAAASGMARGSGGGPATFSHQQQMFANANAAAYAANLVAYQHQFFQHLPSHNFGNTPAPHHHPQPHPLMAAAAAAAAAAQQQHHHQQNGQPSQQLGAATAAATGQGGGQQQQQPQHVQNQFQQQQQPQRPQQQPAVVPQHRASGQLVRDLRTVELPFYDQIKVIVPMTELPPYPVPTRPGDGRATHSFAVPSEDIQKVHYRSEEQPLPRYELQLRMFLLETSEEQQDAFPPGSVVRLDEYHVGLPPVIPTNKPNAEQKRYPRPVNITPYAQPPRSRNKPHCLNFEWNGDKRAWAFTVTLVKRLNSEILLDRILKNPNARRPLDRTKQTIIRRLNGDEDDVQMDSMKTSLMDPLMRTRIKIPSRAADCTHLQCFDLNSYLMMSEKRPTWKCPVCDKNAIYSKLIIDTYFEQVLSNAGAAVDEVELLRDGSWRLPLEHDTMGVESEEEKFGTALAAAAVSGGDGTNAEDVNANAGGDDDDDDIMVVTVPVPKKRAVASAGAGGNEPPSFDFLKQPKSAAVQQHQPPAQQLQKRMPSSSSAAPTPDIDIICLSSDDEEAENRQMARAIAASSRQQQLQQHHHQMMLGALGGGNNKNNVDGTYRRSNSGGGGCAAGTSSSSTTSNGGGDSSSTSSSSANASAAPTTAQNGQSSAAAAAPTGVVPEAVIAGGAAGPVLRNAGDRAKSIGSAYAASPTSVNNTPMLRVNGVHPPIFRPTIDEVAKRQIAHNLALFLQHVCAKNNKT